MPRYSFRFNQVEMQQVWFDAAHLEEATALLKKCEDDEMEIVDLPKIEERNHGIRLDFSVSLLECETPA